MKVLIDRELIERAAHDTDFREIRDELLKAIEEAPEAVMAIEKAHDCSVCEWKRRDDCDICWQCGASTCEGDMIIDPYINNQTAPEDCPQILK